jgi:hypothetical protein
MHTYETVTEAVNDLQKRGYTTNFNIDGKNECLICQKNEMHLSKDEFEIDEIYRFEGNTDPGDEMIVYAVSSAIDHVKGIVVNAFGMYEDGGTSDLIRHLSQHLH